MRRKKISTGDTKAATGDKRSTYSKADRSTVQPLVGGKMIYGIITKQDLSPLSLSISLIVFILILFLPYALPTTFWAADPKGTMSYRTQGVISVYPSVCTSVHPSVRPPQRGWGASEGLRYPQTGLRVTQSDSEGLRGF